MSEDDTLRKCPQNGEEKWRRVLASVAQILKHGEGANAKRK